MGKGANGVKAGAIAGILYGAVSAVFSYLALVIFKTQIIATLDKYISGNSILSSAGITAQSLYNSELSVGPIGSVVGGIIIGLILGAIFAYAYARLPGKSAGIKGLSFGIILWLIFNVLIGLASVSEYGMNYYLFSIGGGVIGVLLYGFVLGRLFAHYQEQDAPVMDDQGFPMN